MEKESLIKFEQFSDLYPKGVERHPLTEIVMQNILTGPVLDIGCGDGNLLKELSKKFECEGFDPSKIAVTKAKTRGLKATISTIEEFNPKKKFKTITLLDVLPYLPNHEENFKKIVNLLDEDGRILVNLCNRHAIRRIFKINHEDEKNFPKYYPTYFEFRRLAKKNGLKIVKSYGGGLFKHFPIFSLAIFYILERT